MDTETPEIMIPRLDISFPVKRQWQYWFGKEYVPAENELLLNHARSGIVLALRNALSHGGRVGVVTYNCHTVANAVCSAGCDVVFLDVTDDLTIDIHQPALQTCDAIVVTNLFGIRNDVNMLRQVCPDAILIVDNAHGYGLPVEGDFTVYSIGQGKYPSLGSGGILVVNNNRFKIEDLRLKIDQLRGIIDPVKEFAGMFINAILYHPWIYGWFTMRLKVGRVNNANHIPVAIKAMSPGVSRLYNAWMTSHSSHPSLSGEGMGVRPSMFMDVIHTKNPEQVILEYKAKGIEADTHFKNCIRWAKEFGYISGTCPNAERLVNELVMIPNYYKK